MQISSVPKGVKTTKIAELAYYLGLLDIKIRQRLIYFLRSVPKGAVLHHLYHDI